MSKDTSMRAPTGDSGAVNPCTVCRLRSLPIFHPPTEGELELIQSLKRREVRLRAGETLIAEGQTDAPLYTLLSGWAFRFKTLADGRRQILNVLLAGDFIGVQQKLSDAAVHGVTALTDSTYCVFQRDALWEIHTKKPALGFDVTWLTAHEESLVDEQLLSVASRAALAEPCRRRPASAEPRQADRGAAGDFRRRTTAWARRGSMIRSPAGESPPARMPGSSQ